jgi:hypothetical protein
MRKSPTKALPLFDDIPVTDADVALWLDRITTLSSTPHRRAAYRKSYNVDEKIRAAKRAGHWPP